MPQSDDSPLPNDLALARKAAIAAGRQLGLSAQELSNMTGTHEDVPNQPDSAAHAAELDACRLVIRAARLLSTLMGGNAANMTHWMNTENHALGTSPKQAMSSYQGLVRTVEYLDAMRRGA